MQYGFPSLISQFDDLTNRYYSAFAGNDTSSLTDPREIRKFYIAEEIREIDEVLSVLNYEHVVSASYSIQYWKIVPHQGMSSEKYLAQLPPSKKKDKLRKLAPLLHKQNINRASILALFRMLYQHCYQLNELTEDEWVRSLLSSDSWAPLEKHAKYRNNMLTHKKQLKIAHRITYGIDPSGGNLTVMHWYSSEPTKEMVAKVNQLYISFARNNNIPKKEMHKPNEYWERLFYIEHNYSSMPSNLKSDYYGFIKSFGHGSSSPVEIGNDLIELLNKLHAPLLSA